MILFCLAAIPLLAGDLHTAVRAGDRELIAKLLDAGANVNEHDALGGTPLHDAAWAGDTAVVRLLLARGANVHARHREAGSTPLHYAVITNHLLVVEMLLNNGADRNATYQSGSTPLHLAANRGYRDIAELLLNRGADMHRRDNTGATPLEEAAWKGQANMVRLFLARGARATASTFLQSVQKGHTEVVRLLIEAGQSLDIKDRDGLTPLEIAIRYRQRATAEVLLQKGARLRNTDAALRNAVMRGEADIVDLLLDHSGDPAAFLPDAALKGHRDIVALLLNRGAPVTPRALLDAALGGHAAVVELLLDRGAPLRAAEPDSGNTALHLAASYGRRGVVILLLDRGADPKLRNKAGKTPRDLALEAEQKEIAEIFDLN